MALIEKSEIRDVTGLDQAKKDAIYHFLQGAVYCWCKNRPNEWFAMRDLMGGDNYYWEGTPLLTLYQKHKDVLGKEWEDAVTGAAKDSGWLLKRVIEDDKRNFETKKEGLVRMYKWDGDSSY